jgi:hypothetical protein
VGKVIRIDEQSITLLNESLALENQPGWQFYNGGDAPDGAFIGWLREESAIDAIVKLPRTLQPGRYFLFARGFSYDANFAINFASGTGLSKFVLMNDRDANAAWTDRAVLDLSVPAETIGIRVNRNPDIAGEQKVLLMGLYITTNEREIVDRYSTAIKLIKPAVMDPMPPIKGNLVVDGGFECGIDASFGFDGRRTVAPIWDPVERCMKIPLWHAANDYGDNMRLVSRVYHLRPNRKHTVSMAVKVTAPGKQVSVALMLKNSFPLPEGAPPHDHIGNWISATDQWQALSGSGNVLDYPTPDYHIVIEANELEGAYLCVKNVQLEEGDFTPFTPAAPIEAGIVIANQPGNVFYEDEAITGTLNAVNHSGAPISATWRCEVYDYMNRLVREDSRVLAISGRTHTSKVVLGAGLRGIFRVVSWIEGLNHTTKEIVFSVVPRPTSTGSDQASFMGIHPQFTDAQFATLRALGFKWARVMSPAGFFRWSNVEPVEGQIVWFDEELKRAKGAGFTVLGTIGTNEFWPKWAETTIAGNKVPDLEKWGSFVKRLASHYKDLVSWWEIWNEPHFTPAYYASLLRVAVDAIEQASPRAKIVAMGGIPRQQMGDFIAAIEELYPKWGWRKHVDAVSTHNYPGNEPPENLADIAKTIEVWNTETGVWDRGFYAGPNSSFVRWGKALFPAQDAVRFYDGMLESANQTAQNFLRTIAAGQKKYFYYDSRAAAAPDYPRSHTTLFEYDGTVRAKGIALAIAGNLIDKAKTVGNLAADPGVYVLGFETAKGPIAALWTNDGKRRLVTIGFKSYQVRWMDLMGNLKPSTSSFGLNTVDIGRVVSYVQGIGVTPADFFRVLRAATISPVHDQRPPNVSILELPTGPVSGPFRARWIAIDETTYAGIGEKTLESKEPGESAPDGMLYSFRLAGHTDEWSPWSPETVKDFTVPPGSYTFEVRAKDQAGNVSDGAARPVEVKNG